MLECLQVIEKGFGMPAFNNDEIVIHLTFLKLGVDKEMRIIIILQSAVLRWLYLVNGAIAAPGCIF